MERVSRRTVGCLLVGVLLAAPRVSVGQASSKVRRIGVIEPGSITPEEIREEMGPLRARGWVEGQNLLVERRYWNGEREALKPLVEQLVEAKVEVIVAVGPNPTRAAMQATKTIPIVLFSADPVAMGLVTSLSQPTGNVTGLSGADYEGHTKLLSLVKEMLPGLRRVGVLEATGNPQARLSRGRMERMVRSLGLEPVFVEVAGLGDIDGAIASLEQQQGQALLLRADSFALVHGAELISPALRRGLPTVTEYADFVRKAGALASYGVSGAEIQRRVQYYVDRLLRGAKPSDLPVEQPSEFKLVINLKTAKTLGLTVPQTVMLQVTEVIR
jgi:putative ABC transport system substrate-binding protein